MQDARCILRDAGVLVGIGAQLDLTADARQSLQHSPWSQDAVEKELGSLPERYEDRPPDLAARSMIRAPAHAKLLAKITRMFDANRAVSLLQRLSEEDATSMLSAGGSGTGTTWSAYHRTPYELLPNSH